MRALVEQSLRRCVNADAVIAGKAAGVRLLQSYQTRIPDPLVATNECVSESEEERDAGLHCRIADNRVLRIHSSELSSP